MIDDAVTRILPFHAPQDAAAQTLLYAIRRIASGGLDDATALNALLGLFGKSYRRPLVLLRAFMAELSRVANRRVAVAPCCCPRMTRDEAAVLDAIALAPENIATAHEQLCAVADADDCLGAVITAHAVARAFADLGRPIAAG